MTANEIIKPVEELEVGESVKHNLDCGSTVIISRTVSGFHVHIADRATFATVSNVDYDEDPTKTEIHWKDRLHYNRLTFFVDADMIPVIRALVAGMQKNVNEAE